MKTADVKVLVEEVLSTMSQPHSEHVIDEVFAAIEHTPAWRREYEVLCGELTKETTNNSVGHWVATTLGKTGKKQVPSTLSTLIGSYSILDTDARTFIRKPNEQEARVLMAEYFRAHKATLPIEIRQRREEIVALLMEGATAEEAFSRVLRDAG